MALVWLAVYGFAWYAFSVFSYATWGWIMPWQFFIGTVVLMGLARVLLSFAD